MRAHSNHVLWIGLGLLSVCGAAVGEAKTPATSGPKTYFLIVGKGKVADPASQQQRGVVAVEKVAAAARKSGPHTNVDALAETVMSKQQYRQGQVTEKVTGAIFKERLRRLAETVTSEDTVVIYTHSHGRVNGFETSQPLGGIVMDLPIRQPRHGGTLLWDQYVTLLLDIPARNVVVLTMACFSGGLVKYLNTPEVRKRWESRHRSEGRNFIVLTSQNKDKTSDPILVNGEVINPFTFAVVKMLAGDADGFQPVEGKPAELRHQDGKLTIGEMIDFVLWVTEHTRSEHPRRKNTAKPQMTGSFDRNDVLDISGSAGGGSHAKSRGRPEPRKHLYSMDLRPRAARERGTSAIQKPPPLSTTSAPRLHAGVHAAGVRNCVMATNLVK